MSVCRKDNMVMLISNFTCVLSGNAPSYWQLQHVRLHQHPVASVPLPLKFSDGKCKCTQEIVRVSRFFLLPNFTLTFGSLTCDRMSLHLHSTTIYSLQDYIRYHCQVHSELLVSVARLSLLATWGPVSLHSISQSTFLFHQAIIKCNFSPSSLFLKVYGHFPILILHFLLRLDNRLLEAV